MILRRDLLFLKHFYEIIGLLALWLSIAEECIAFLFALLDRPTKYTITSHEWSVYLNELKYVNTFLKLFINLLLSDVYF